MYNSAYSSVIELKIVSTITLASVAWLLATRLFGNSIS